MDRSKQNIPTYSLKSFSHPEFADRQFQVEVFDANRHFQVNYPHRHDFFEMLYINKGSGIHLIDSSEYKVNPPCIFFMSPGQAHKLMLSNDIEGYIYIFTADYYLFDKNNQNRLLEFPFFFTIKQDNTPVQLLSPWDCSFMEQLFKVAIKELTRENYNLHLLRSVLDTLLNYASTLYKGKEPGVKSGKGHLLVKRFYQLVEDNYQLNWSVNEYAIELAVTPNHLTQTLKQLTGRTTNDILKSKLVLEIKRLLVHTNLTITQIADELNFTDQSYFTKYFKKTTGVTPNQFRSVPRNVL